jgi:RimJ/RimL family protein N-acetyltransferase
MNFDLQPTLENEFVKIRPLREDEFEPLYAVASDPLIWEQHPNKDRYKRDVFQNYFKGALESKGAILALDAKNGLVIGSSRYYELDEANSSVAIGYTFLARSYWGGKYNPALKSLMLNHAFQFVDNVIFHVGAENIRSQKAMEKLGGVKINEIVMAYYGEPDRHNFVYRMEREAWRKDKR